jgi:hypothetical protein
VPHWGTATSRNSELGTRASELGSRNSERPSELCLASRSTLARLLAIAARNFDQPSKFELSRGARVQHDGSRYYEARHAIEKNAAAIAEEAALRDAPTPPPGTARAPGDGA